MRALLLVVAAVAFHASCPSPSSSTPPLLPATDGGPAPITPPGPASTTCTAACANVVANVSQCPEGHYADCASTCTTVQNDPHQVQPNVAQLTTAKTVAQVRAAGWTCRFDGG